jgi:hypothetical protein
MSNVLMAQTPAVLVQLATDVLLPDLSEIRLPLVTIGASVLQRRFWLRLLA